MGALLTYALNESSSLVYIDDVVNVQMCLSPSAMNLFTTRMVAISESKLFENQNGSAFKLFSISINS